MADSPRPSSAPDKKKRKRRLRAVSVLRVLFLLIIYGASLAAAGLYLVITTINQDLPADLTPKL